MMMKTCLIKGGIYLWRGGGTGESCTSPYKSDNDDDDNDNHVNVCECVRCSGSECETRVSDAAGLGVRAFARECSFLRLRLGNRADSFLPPPWHESVKKSALTHLVEPLLLHRIPAPNDEDINMKSHRIVQSLAAIRRRVFWIGNETQSHTMKLKMEFRDRCKSARSRARRFVSSLFCFLFSLFSRFIALSRSPHSGSLLRIEPNPRDCSSHPVH